MRGVRLMTNLQGINLKEVSIEEQIKFINMALINHADASVRKLCNTFGINCSTFSGKCSKLGYAYNSKLRQYVSKDDKQLTFDIDSSTSSMSKIKELSMYLSNDLNRLVPYVDKLISMAERNMYCSNKTGIINTTIIEEMKNNKEHTLYANVEEEFRELTRQYPQYAEVDLLSTAVHEYCLKYKKC